MTILYRVGQLCLTGFSVSARTGVPLVQSMPRYNIAHRTYPMFYIKTRPIFYIRELFTAEQTPYSRAEHI